mgnify:CR=1
MAEGAASAPAQKKSASAAAMGVIGNMQGILLTKVKVKNAAGEADLPANRVTQ